MRENFIFEMQKRKLPRAVIVFAAEGR